MGTQAAYGSKQRPASRPNPESMFTRNRRRDHDGASPLVSGVINACLRCLNVPP